MGSNEVAACEFHVQVHSGRRSHSTEQDYITNDVEADVEDESPPISQRAEENPGNDNVEYLERNREEHNIEMVTDDDDNNSEEDSSDDNDDHEQVSTSIVTSRSH